MPTIYTIGMKLPDYLIQYFDPEEVVIKITDRIFRVESNFREHSKYSGKNKKMLIVSGLSGAGKDSIVAKLVATDKRFSWVKTCTTRPRRPEETEENDPYVRITEEYFLEAVKNNDVIESVEYAGNRYCTLNSLFQNAFEVSEIPILRIDPVGCHYFTKMCDDNKGIFAEVKTENLFVVPPSIEELKNRLLNRSGDQTFVDKRIEQMELDIPYVKDATYVVVNETGKLDQVAEEITKLFA